MALAIISQEGEALMRVLIQNDLALAEPEGPVDGPAAAGRVHR